MYMDSLKEVAKEYYESHRVSFATLSNISENVLGRAITVDQLKKWSQEDAGWDKQSLTGNEKLGFIANLLFDKIEEEADSLSARDLTQLANTYLSIAVKAPDTNVGDAKPTLQKIMDTAHAMDGTEDSGGN
jgi:hypothetical protein